jgi:hypothetical protein
MANGYASFSIEKESEYKQTKTFYDASGSPINISEGYATVVTTYTPRGQTLSESYYDANGKPVLTTYGHAKEAYTFDERNRYSTKTFYDLNGEPVNGADDFAYQRYEYDQSSRIISYTSYDEQGNLTINTDRDTAREEILYNERSQEIQRAYYGIDGKLRSGEGKYAFEEYEYDTKGNTAQITYLDYNRQFRVSDSYFSQIKYAYNRKNNRIAYEGYCFDAEGNWRDCANGYAFIVVRYKDDGTEETPTTYTAAEMNAGAYDAQK